MHITNADITQAGRVARAFSFMTLVRPILLLLLLAGLLAACWPQKHLLQTAGPGRNVQRARVLAKVTGLGQAVLAKREARAAFNAEEIGLFLQNRPNLTTNDIPLTVRIEGDRLVVLQQMSLGPLAVGAKTVGPFRYTRQVSCRSVGRKLVVQGGAFGHLPLPGPLKNLVAKPVLKAFVPTPIEQSIHKKISKMIIQDGKLEISVAP
ncbi:MAG: hypothetical protein R6X19_01640 [Kiritimatiellia bacterium]